MNRRSVGVALLMVIAFAIWVCALQAQAQATIKIMPLGDSITFGTPNPNYGGYRRLLGKLLNEDGLRIQFVGSQQSGQSLLLDPDNEGHPGWTAGQIKQGVDTQGWLETYRPDIILLHIGTNDIRVGYGQCAPAMLSELLDDILNRLPNVHVFVAQIITAKGGGPPALLTYNRAIPDLVASKGPRVTLVDMQNILSPGDYADPLHPVPGGYDKMARTWEPAIRAFLTRYGGGNNQQQGNNQQGNGNQDHKAEASWRAMEKAFALPGKPGFFKNFLTDKTPAAIWAHSQGIGAALDMAELTGDYAPARNMLSSIDAYQYGNGYAPYPLPGPVPPSKAPKRFFDDNGWIGLDLMQAYTQTHDASYLEKAKKLFIFISKGQNPQGGIRWREGSDPNSACMPSNGSNAEWLLRLYLATNNPAYLQFAQGAYQYMQKVFLVTGNDKGVPEGLYYNGTDGLGPPKPGAGHRIFSYNQGTAIGVNLLFYKITRDQKYLANASRTAEAALQYFSGDRLWRECPAFLAILFRNVLALDQVAPNPIYRQALDQYLHEVWTRARNQQTGLFDQGGIGHYGQTVDNYLDQSALVQLFALSQWQPQALNMVH